MPINVWWLFSNYSNFFNIVKKKTFLFRSNISKFVKAYSGKIFRFQIVVDEVKIFKRMKSKWVAWIAHKPLFLISKWNSRVLNWVGACQFFLIYKFIHAKSTKFVLIINERIWRKKVLNALILLLTLISTYVYFV